MSNKFKNIAIIGVGLLGGSLALALKRRGDCRLIGCARGDIARQWSQKHRVFDEFCREPEVAAAKADLTVLALPLPVLPEFMARCAPHWREGSVVTDVGSCKMPVMRAGAELFRRGVRFVGSHPMAGTEKTGCENAFAELYENSDVFVTPYDDTPPEVLAGVEELWRAVGGKPARISPEHHDELVARTSHVLHIIASSLTLSILDPTGDADLAERFRGCATGFKDSSRIASSSPQMWREIIAINRENVLIALRDFDRRLERFRKFIQEGDFDAFEREFARGRELRGEWLEYKGF